MGWVCVLLKSQVLPVVRENSVLADFIGFSSSGDPSCRHENSAHDGGLAVSKPGSFRKAQSGRLDADSRVTTAARGIPAQVEEAPAEKQGPSILVVALKGLERLEIGADFRRTRDRDPMEGEEVSRVLAEEVPGSAGQTYNSQ